MNELQDPSCTVDILFGTGRRHEIGSQADLVQIPALSPSALCDGQVTQSQFAYEDIYKIYSMVSGI